MKKPLSRTELQERLRAMCLVKKPTMRYRDRHIYITYADNHAQKTFVCDRCGKRYRVEDFGNHAKEYDYVKQMRLLGYDVKIEYVCNECLGKPTTMEKFRSRKTGIISEIWLSMFEDDPEWEKVEVPYVWENEVFMFRINPDEPYHETEGSRWCNNFNYEILLHFLKGKNCYSTYYTDMLDGADHYIDEHQDVIEKLTGICLSEDQLKGLPLTKRGLIERLASRRSIYVKPVSFDNVRLSEDEIISCEGCGCKIAHIDDDFWRYLKGLENRIRDLGYDAKIMHFCPECHKDNGRHRWKPFKSKLFNFADPLEECLVFCFRVPRNVKYQYINEMRTIEAIYKLLADDNSVVEGEQITISTDYLASKLGLGYYVERFQKGTLDDVV